MSKSLVLIGGGGHCRSIIDIIESQNVHSIYGIVEHDRISVGQLIQGYEVIGTDNELTNILKSCSNFLITIGQIENSFLREKIYHNSRKLGGIPLSVFSGNAYVSKHAFISDGVSIGHFSIINAGSRVGCNTIVNNRVLVEHDVIVGSHCHLATSCVLNGNVTIEDNVFIGSNATILQGLTICSGSIIGAGAVVLKSIIDPGVYVGNPAKLIK